MAQQHTSTLLLHMYKTYVHIYLLSLVCVCVCVCVTERYGRSVVLAWLTVCGCAAVRGSFGNAERALLPKSLRNVRFGSVSVLTYRPPYCLSFSVSFSLLGFNLKVMKWGVKIHHLKARRGFVCVRASALPSTLNPETGATEAAGVRLS